MITFGSPQALEILAKGRILERWQGYDNHPFFVIMVYCAGDLPKQLIKAQAEVEKWIARSQGAEECDEPQEVVDEIEKEYCEAVNASEELVKKAVGQIPDEYQEAVVDYLDSTSSEDMLRAKINYRELLEAYKKG